jgi:hypothetical protein
MTRTRASRFSMNWWRSAPGRSSSIRTWSVGDVMLWDQRAVMHRGTPWPYEEPRKLDSTCSSVRDSDGLSAMRPDPVAS